MIGSINTETANCWPIPNQQNIGIVGNEDVMARRFLSEYDARLRSIATTRYNCHGLTFGSRRTCIDDPKSIAQILSDDGYKHVAREAVLPGDIVLYYDIVDGTVSHSGLVVGVPSDRNSSVLVVSKWGVVGAEYLHAADKCPYKGEFQYFRIDHSAESVILSKILLGY